VRVTFPPVAEAGARGGARPPRARAARGD